ncbi:hypothetical protein TNCV_1718501 [Trichonephila clavipes]|nr:hypothetical protein TNCV_1718501 [Trichonephila clavipes]
MRRPVPGESGVWGSCCVPFGSMPRRREAGDPCGEGYAAEELRASSVTAPRNALPKAVPEDEELGCGWLGGGDSFISRNPPWLRPWTVPGSTLWGFPRCLALKNPPAVTLGTDFHRKLEDDTLTGDCSEDDEDLMDIQSGPFGLLAPEEERSAAQ